MVQKRYRDTRRECIGLLQGHHRIFADIERVLAGERSVWDSRDLGDALIQEQSADADVKNLIHSVMFKKSFENIFALNRG